MKTIRYFSMFSGIGGFEYGMEQSNVDFESVGHCEVDTYAESIYSRHFPECRNYGDATEIRTEELSDFDFLVGGFPCQSFSNSGTKRGFDDTRGTLFFEIARILKDKRPPYFLLENVRGLLHHDEGKTFKKILEILSDLGYYVKWEVFDSKDFGGVPQKRERIFIEGYSRRECGREVLSFRNGYENNNASLTSKNYNTTDAFDYSYLSKDTENNLMIKLRESTKKGYKEAYPFDGVLLNRGNRKIAKGIVRDQHCGCLQTSGVWGTVTSDFRIRKLTPLECERLQGFPDNWTKWGKDGELISDTQRYKTIGNAVTTTVVTAIVNKMFDK